MHLTHQQGEFAFKTVSSAGGDFHVGMILAVINRILLALKLIPTLHSSDNIPTPKSSDIVIGRNLILLNSHICGAGCSSAQV